MQEKRKFFDAVAVLIGTIIGAGIFAIPYVVMRAGILVGIFYFLFLGIIVLTIHLIYGEITLRTSVHCRAVGYGEKYLGSFGKKTLFTALLISLPTLNLSYLILGGDFLRVIFNGQAHEIIFYVTFFWLLMSLGIFLDWRRASFAEFLMTLVLILAIVAVIIYGFSRLKTENIRLFNFRYFFLPWGVIFYSLSGNAAISELKEILGSQRQRLKKVIIIATIVPIVIYFLFAISIIGASGGNTTEDSIDGLKNLFGKETIYLMAIVGFLSVATSYLVIGMSLKKIFILDIKMHKLISGIIACSVPLMMYFVGLRNFLFVVSFLGLWLGAVEGTLLLIMHRRAKKMGDRQPEYSLNIPKFVYYLIGLIFILGPILSFIFVKH